MICILLQYFRKRHSLNHITILNYISKWYTFIGVEPILYIKDLFDTIIHFPDKIYTYYIIKEIQIY
jgi:hypothetical protein